MLRNTIMTVALVAVLGLVGLGVAHAEDWYVEGCVYFTETNGEPVPCVDVYLYSSSGCFSTPIDTTVTDAAGHFSFLRDSPDSVWVQIVFDADKVCLFCAGGGYHGTCSDETSDCRGPVTIQTEDLHFNLDQPDCECR